MRRLWLLAALLLSLLPSLAAASECAAAAGGPRYDAASPPDLGDQARAAAGFEIVAAREQGVARWKGPRSSSPAPQPPASAGLAPLHAAIRGRSRPAPRGSVPLCERLPYQATAPPLRG